MPANEIYRRNCKVIVIRHHKVTIGILIASTNGCPNLIYCDLRSQRLSSKYACHNVIIPSSFYAHFRIHMPVEKKVQSLLNILEISLRGSNRINTGRWSRVIVFWEGLLTGHQEATSLNCKTWFRCCKARENYCTNISINTLKTRIIVIAYT